MAKILICEDNAAVRNMLCEFATTQGHTSIPVENGAACIMQAQSQRPPIVFIDVQLPGTINGYQVCRTLRENDKTKDCYIIILTGRRGQEAIASAKEAGANAFLRKPFRYSEVEEVIKRGLKKMEESQTGAGSTGSDET